MDKGSKVLHSFPVRKQWEGIGIGLQKDSHYSYYDIGFRISDGKKLFEELTTERTVDIAIKGK
jgi:hypothetical protein